MRGGVEKSVCRKTNEMDLDRDGGSKKKLLKRIECIKIVEKRFTILSFTLFSLSIYFLWSTRFESGIAALISEDMEDIRTVGIKTRRTLDTNMKG